MLLYRDFLSSIWPVNDFAVSGEQLEKMYTALAEREKKQKAPKPEKAPRDDLEDGEIDSDRDNRRDGRRDNRERDRDYRRDAGFRRDDRRDTPREERRDDRRDDVRRMYENGDRLSFNKRRDHDRDRDRDRGRSSWPARHSPY